MTNTLHFAKIQIHVLQLQMQVWPWCFCVSGPFSPMRLAWVGRCGDTGWIQMSSSWEEALDDLWSTWQQKFNLLDLARANPIFWRIYGVMFVMWTSFYAKWWYSAFRKMGLHICNHSSQARVTVMPSLRLSSIFLKVVPLQNSWASWRISHNYVAYLKLHTTDSFAVGNDWHNLALSRTILHYLTLYCNILHYLAPS